MNLAELTENAYDRLGDHMSLDFEGQRFTNTQLMDYSRRLQRGFENLGMQRGSNIVLCLINHPLVFPVFGGIFRTGATAIPVMFLLSAPELRYVFQDSGAEGIITDKMCLGKVREAAAGLDHIKWIMILDGEPDPNTPVREVSLEPLLQEPPQEKWPSIAGNDTAIMMYTSGTTGKPKGVMLTHDNLYAQGQASLDATEFDSWEGPAISMSAMPMAHIFGVGVMIGSYMVPKRIVEEGGYGVQMAWFDTERFMGLIQQHQCTNMAAVPTMLSLILNHPKVDDYDLTSLREVICGASSLPEEVARAFERKCGCRIREIYGLTENAGLGTANRRSKPYKPGSAGLAYCNVELKIFDSTDQSLTSGEKGEIVMRGPSVMKGYYNLPDKTAEAMRSGWLHTGDVGYLDEDGYLFVVDRVKDMIIRGGENIYPAELEDILYRFPGVAEAAVVGTPDPVYGENIVAFVVPGHGASLNEKDIIEFMRTQTSSFKTPGTVYFVDSLPKSPIGKILRRELRQQAADLEK
ncbi:AMP-binding protein [bacterium]|nr:AMP-binding protein [bacterium]